MAGHEESGGQTIEENGKMYKMFYGMSSEYAHQDNIMVAWQNTAAVKENRKSHIRGQ